MPKECPAYKDTMAWIDATPLQADSKINDRSTDQTAYSVVCCFYYEILNTAKLLNHVAPCVELMMQK